MSEKNNQTTTEELLKGLENYITTKTVVGEAIHVGETILLPLAEASFGVAIGDFKNSADTKHNQSGGMGGKISPCAVLVIKDGTSKLINVKGQDGMSKILDLVPDVVNKFTDKKEKADSKTDGEDVSAKDTADDFLA